jgi:acetyl-CoA carboxylase biotin carboxyl carrier protein
VPVPQVLAPQVLAAPILAPSPLVAVEGIQAAERPATPAPARSDAEQGVPIPSPMVGTFYRAASPEAEPFVAEGSKVAPETVICIIEAMKVMNEIKAERAGQILRVLVENGEPVEFGQPLFLIRPA